MCGASSSPSAAISVAHTLTHTIVTACSNDQKDGTGRAEAHSEGEVREREGGCGDMDHTQRYPLVQMGVSVCGGVISAALCLIGTHRHTWLHLHPLLHRSLCAM